MEILCKKIENLVCFITQLDEAIAANEKCPEIIDLIMLKKESIDLLEAYKYELTTM